jgi:hypothetical protein
MSTVRSLFDKGHFVIKFDIEIVSLSLAKYKVGFRLN